MSVVKHFICRLFGHPCFFKGRSEFTPVVWEDDYMPSNGFYPLSGELERNEIVASEDNYSCIKIEDFQVCWCGEFESRKHLEYEA